MNRPITTEETYHISNILKHYADAREKHPYFCDGISPFDIGYAQMDQTFEEVVEERRDDVAYHAKKHSLLLEHLIDCEWSEVICEYDRGNDALAVQKLYDLAVLCLRAIDVLEGRQKLGKPKSRNNKNKTTK